MLTMIASFPRFFRTHFLVGWFRFAFPFNLIFACPVSYQLCFVAPDKSFFLGKECLLGVKKGITSTALSSPIGQAKIVVCAEVTKSDKHSNEFFCFISICFALFSSSPPTLPPLPHTSVSPHECCAAWSFLAPWNTMTLKSYPLRSSNPFHLHQFRWR